MNFKSLSLAAAAAIAIVMPAWAHHSHANYQTLEWTNLSGTVKELQWLNPHVWLYLQTMDDKGQPRLWTLEGGSPAALTRGGWKKDTVKAGDKISVRCHVAKDGSDNCLLGFLTTDGGVPKEFD
jgi:hypothetical protein